MFIKKKFKKGFILLQASIVLMLTIFIASLSLKIISNNFLKSKLYYSYEDLSSLNFNESEFLQLAIEAINLDLSSYENLKNKAIENSKEVKIYSNSNYKSFSIIHNSKKLYMVEAKGNGKRYIGLDEVIKDDKLYLVPNSYRTDYIL
ncbi:hypothetical protein [Caproiciproducens sp. MSJ-32]|uniref:hypothetical protein n=1 Tax=Caproiciproducens sp. MSJ-32 TaxID=2841527 RepID=UPI001C109FC6|nr:hypothetical protein [Caproiciproducens sp. MSJ-32]MBU5454590.1 hypothetical protein [Caproiciproducens sp. MSJ-32]